MKIRLLTIIIIFLSLMGCSSLRMQWLRNDNYCSKSKLKYQKVKKETYEKGNIKRIEKEKMWELRIHKNSVDASAGRYYETKITNYYKNGKIKSDSIIKGIIGFEINCPYPQNLKYKKYHITGKLKEKGNIKRNYINGTVTKQNGIIKYYSEQGKSEKVIK